jgi:hypothetical protein
VHRIIRISGNPQRLRQIAEQLREVEEVIGLALHEGASLKPPGDVVVVNVLNQKADLVMERAARAVNEGDSNIVIAESSALVDRPRGELIAKDADESLWEEMESGLRNHGRLSVNYLVLMILGGSIAAVGLASRSVAQVTAFVGASIISPGFEPIGKLAQGLVLRKPKVLFQALLSLLVGYGVYVAAAALAFTVLRVAGQASRANLLTDEAQGLAAIAIRPLLASACAAVAGMIMVVSLRDFYVIGTLIVLVMMPGAALLGASVAVGDGPLAVRALGRLGTDMGLTVLMGAAVFFWKQRRFHRRRPLS